ncbi:MAG: right-handed parallel beta-helix repeat-containing protein [Planctomycetota bacterium]
MSGRVCHTPRPAPPPVSEEKQTRFVSGFVLSLCVAASASAPVIFVNERADRGGDGSSWDRAFQTLTEALAIAPPGIEVWVAEGTYRPEQPSGRDATFTVPGGVALYGGFQGIEDDRDDRDPDGFVAELTGDGELYTVVTTDGDDIIIDGFTITGGNSNGDITEPPPTPFGGGIYSNDHRIILRNNRFSEHFAERGGSAVALTGTPDIAPLIEDCIFENNDGNRGVLEIQWLGIVNDCRFQNNTTEAIRPSGTEVIFITDSVFFRNQGTAATVVFSGFGSQCIIDGCSFIENEGVSVGGVFYGIRGDHIIVNSVFRGNTATSFAGGVRSDLDPGSSLLIENSVFTGNVGPRAGAISVSSPGPVTVTGCTIVGNECTNPVGGGITVTDSGSVTINNSIIYDNITANTPSGERESVAIDPGSSGTANHSAIEFLGDGGFSDRLTINASISANPMFVDADGADNTFGTADDNFRLQPGSPCIDRGNNLFVGLLVFSDISSQARFRDDTGTPDTGVPGGISEVVDIGAAEFQGTTPSDCVADTNGDGMLAPNDFNAWILAFNNQTPACDQNGDGLCRQNDFNAWILNFNNGCG